MRSLTSTAWREPAQATFMASTSNCAVALSPARWSTSPPSNSAMASSSSSYYYYY
jgi:hypothetical protein